MPQKTYTALSLFSGIGGLCEGIKLAGFHITGAAEWDKYACENYRLNFPDTPLYEGDVASFFPLEDEVANASHRQKFADTERLDLLFGGPPCQGFSQIGPRDVADPRNEMYLEMCRIARQLNPRFILMENVPNMLLMKKGLFRQRITAALSDAGYDNVGIIQLSAENYGVPQARKRVFIIAAKSVEFPHDMLHLMTAVSEKHKAELVSVNDAISDLPEQVAADNCVRLSYEKPDVLSSFQKEMRLDSDGALYCKKKKTSHYRKIESASFLCNHHTKDIQSKRLALIRLLKPGKKADSLPKSVWNNARPEKWRRFDGNLPAHTLLAQMHRDLSEWVHPVHHRWITVREALRLQSFHDGFVLGTSEWQQLKQVGNAVPPLLGRIPGLMVASALGILSGIETPPLEAGQLNLFGKKADAA